jgi:hypothetical protein
MLWTERSQEISMNNVRKFLCSSFLWVLLAPWTIAGLGAASNQLVLIANHDKFPVMINAYRLEKMMTPKENTFESLITSAFGKPNPAYEISPLVTYGMIDEVHCVMTTQTHLNFLADVFDLKDSIYSIGDFGLMLGEYLQTFCPYVFLALILKKSWDAEAV